MKKLLFISLLLSLFFVSGCKTRTIFVPVQRDSTVYRIKTDSILMYRHDSIFIRMKNDTVFYEKYRTLLVHRDRTDTLKVEIMREIPVPQPPVVREVVPRWCWWLILICAGYLFVRVLLWKFRR